MVIKDVRIFLIDQIYHFYTKMQAGKIIVSDNINGSQVYVLTFFHKFSIHYSCKPIVNMKIGNINNNLADKNNTFAVTVPSLYTTL